MDEVETVNDNKEPSLSSSELPECQVDLQSNLIAGEVTNQIVDESTSSSSNDKLSKKRKKEEPPSKLRF